MREAKLKDFGRLQKLCSKHSKNPSLEVNNFSTQEGESLCGTDVQRGREIKFDRLNPQNVINLEIERSTRKDSGEISCPSVSEDSEA